MRYKGGTLRQIFVGHSKGLQKEMK